MDSQSVEQQPSALEAGGESSETEGAEPAEPEEAQRGEKTPLEFCWKLEQVIDPKRRCTTVDELLRTALPDPSPDSLKTRADVVAYLQETGRVYYNLHKYPLVLARQLGRAYLIGETRYNDVTPRRHRQRWTAVLKGMKLPDYSENWRRRLMALFELFVHFPRLLLCKIGSDTLFNNIGKFTEYVESSEWAAARWRDLTEPPAMDISEIVPPDRELESYLGNVQDGEEIENMEST